MRVHRRLLTWGVFLVAAGAVLVASDVGALGTAGLTDVLRLWPLAVIAIGLSIVFRRTRVSLPLVLIAAALPGIVIGSAFAIGPRFAGQCAARGDTTSTPSRDGRFAGPSTVAIRSGCGALTIQTTSGDAWRLDASASAPGKRPPTVSATASSLAIDTGSVDDWILFDGERRDGTLTLPTSRIDDLAVTIVAGRLTAALPGADIGRLAVTVNAGDATIDAASTADIGKLSGTVNLGRLSLELPAASDLTGSFRVNAGELRICIPAGLGVRIEPSGNVETIRVHGVTQSSSAFENADYASAAHRAELSVHINLGALEIDPIGGCK